MVYLIGSLRNPEVPNVASRLRAAGHDVFDDWFGAGPTADDSWREYELARGRTYAEALDGLAAKHVFAFDKWHLERADTVVLLMPAGKSAFLELGWALGQGKRGYILLNETKDPRWDVMFQFATGVHAKVDTLLEALK